MQLMLQCNFRIVKLDVEYATDKFGRQTNFFQVEEFQVVWTIDVDCCTDI